MMKIKTKYRSLAHWCRMNKLKWSSLVILWMILVLIFYFMSELEERPRATPNSRLNCQEVSTLHRKELFALLATTTRLLDQLRINHFLCFKSLWSAVLESGPFPWEINAHLCTLNNPGNDYDEPTLLRTFRKANLNLDYSSAEARYVISNMSLPGGSPTVQVTVFEEDPRVGANIYRRVGWKRRLLPPNCDSHSSLQCFPASLVALPLPLRTYGPLRLPAPRDNMELLKFHYPDIWHKPPTC
ncbi:uncharacterized protein LOC108676899 [Hyalella azteca]|uniref:Uncharacterized protein LOC108676899 n=1 Tax=Hyalella azteca TaxID=294128 RepID=A0A8B7P3C5_HYAAZ|nr:uncharacterized protein LOC108676899 [Hyalella azteca]